MVRYLNHRLHYFTANWLRCFWFWIKIHGFAWSSRDGHDCRRGHSLDPLFEFLDDGQKITGFKGLDNHAVSPDAVGVFRFVRLHLADGQKHRRFNGGDV